MIFKAVVSNKAHPEYGQAAIPFPIPASEYDHTIELLEGLDIGSPTVQDCRVDELDGPYPILNRLAAQSVNVDELDYLAKRLESFCKDEGIQFQAMASKLSLSDIKDFINLTFCCQQATSSEQVPYLSLPPLAKARSFHCSSSPNRNRCAGFRFGFAPTSYSAGVVTSYGVVYDNGMKLEQVYTGRSFPQYLYDAPLLTLWVPIQPEIGGVVETAWLYLPAPEQQIARTLNRIGIINQDAAYFIEDSTLSPKIFEILERPDDTIPDLNRRCQAIKGLETAEVEKLEAVALIWTANPTSKNSASWRSGSTAWANRGGLPRSGAALSGLCRDRRGILGAYTPNGYVKRRDAPQEQSVVEESKFLLTLMSISDTYRLSLPTSDDELERARQALKGIIASTARRWTLKPSARNTAWMSRRTPSNLRCAPLHPMRRAFFMPWSPRRTRNWGAADAVGCRISFFRTCQG